MSVNQGTPAASCRIDGEVAFLPVHRGDVVASFGQIDVDLLDAALRWKWRDDRYGYAVARGAEHRIKLHHFVVGRPPAGFVVDHINGDKLDNRRCNLRVVTYAVNQQNRFSANAQGKSRHRGVSWNARLGKWQVHLQLDGETVYGGLFRDEERAAEVARALRTVLMPGSEEARP